MSLGVALTLSVMAGSGCVVKDLSRTVEYTVKGDYFLQSDQPDRGRQSFKREVGENPGNTLANYYYGRFLLQENENKQALAYLRKARDLDPANADYHFWAGVAFGANGMTTEEEKSYRAALAIDPESSPVTDLSRAQAAGQKAVCRSARFLYAGA